MRKVILSNLLIIAIISNLIVLFSSCTKKSSKKLNFNEYSTKLSTKECSDIKKKLENNGYNKIDFVIKKDFASISIDYNYEEINVSSSEYNT
ncbi:MAG: hypothetical protein ABF289_07055, partial [Clostridiales bacterium]